jgi:hypothetical protein
MSCDVVHAHYAGGRRRVGINYGVYTPPRSESIRGVAVPRYMSVRDPGRAYGKIEPTSHGSCRSSSGKPMQVLSLDVLLLR